MRSKTCKNKPFNSNNYERWIKYIFVVHYNANKAMLYTNTIIHTNNTQSTQNM